jgi:hypothetical protein
MRRILTVLPLAALPFTVGPAQPVVIRSQQPVIQTGLPQRPTVNRQYAAWLPPGTYSAIVLNSSGDERRWAVSLMTKRANVPIVIPPNDNTIIEFKNGWTITAADEARLVSNLVPFDDSALYNKVGEQPYYVLSAWGITDSGPVPFVYREIQP